MKRSIAIIFAILLCLPLLVLEGTITIEKYIIRREVKHRLMDKLENEDLVRISLSNNEASQLLRWEKPDEFEFYGRMYDVVRLQESESAITYWCWPDADESYLNQFLSSIISHSTHNKKSQKSNLLISFFKSIYFTEKQSITTTAEHIAIVYYSSSAHYLNWTFEPAIPPPDSKYVI